MKKTKAITMVALIPMTMCLAAMFAERSMAVPALTVEPLNISVGVRPSKLRYTLGEVVEFDIEVENRGNSAVKIRSIDVRSGFLQLFLAKNNQNFRKYSHSAWIGGGQKRISLEPGQSLQSKGDIYWNSKPRTTHLNKLAAERIERERILSDYAFDEPGVYQIKAVMILPEYNGLRIESTPIDIFIDYATGSDLEVWNRIRNNGDFAYFIQQGEIPGSSQSRSNDFVTSLRSISSEFPESLLGKQIAESLSRYEKMLEKKAIFLRGIQK
jgi:hypothetical protein